jgi:Zn-dependent peptidase ImmA (M78 family)
MKYEEYKNSRDAAWKILRDQNISSLPVPVVKICRNLGIVVKFNDELSDKINSGQCTIIDGQPFIFIAPDCPPQRRRFTIAHELGHILLGHVGQSDLINREPSPMDSPIEQAANVFASRLLAPVCVLWGCGVQTAEEISKLCDISKTAAEYRFKRYQVLLKRDRFLSSPLERQVFDNFRPFIQEHRASR